MTYEEWQLVATILENAWKGDWDEARSLSYFALLEPYPLEDVERALHLIVRNGSPWIPSVAEIVSAIESGRRAAVPTWPEAWHAIKRAISRYSRNNIDAALKQLAELHPAVASWAGTYGWVRLCDEPVYGDHGGAVLKRLEDSYNEHVERALDRERQGIAIETTQRRSLAGGPRKLMAAQLLGGGQAA